MKTLPTVLTAVAASAAFVHAADIESKAGSCYDKAAKKGGNASTPAASRLRRPARPARSATRSWLTGRAGFRPSGTFSFQASPCLYRHGLACLFFSVR